MTIFVWILAIVLILALLILLVPIDIRWRRKKGEKSLWTFSVFVLRFGSGGSGIFKKVFKRGRKNKSKKKVLEDDEEKDIKSDEDRAEVKKTSTKRKKFDIDNMKFFIARRKLALKIFNVLFKFIRDLIKSHRIRRSDINLYAAFEDPYHLGILCAVIFPLCRFIPRKLNFAFHPDFEMGEDKIEVFGEFFIRIRVYNILWSVMLLLCRLPKIELFKLFREIKSRRQTQ